MKIKTAIALFMMASVSACSMQEGDFPSLAKRPFEDNKPVTSPEPSAPSVSRPSSEVQTLVDTAMAQSNAAHSQFLKDLRRVTGHVNAARGSAMSSERWVVAQMDLAALEIVRGPSVSALADIDRIYTSQMNRSFDDENAGGTAMVESKRQEILAQVKQQQDEIDALKAKLR